MTTMFRAITVLAIAGASIWALSCGDETVPAGTAEPRASLRTIQPDRLLAYQRLQTPSLFIRTAQDVLPGGLAAAMAPVMVDWARTDLEGPDPTVTLWNLNEGGNPVSGTTALRAARFDLGALDRAEIIIVPLDGLGRRGFVAHAMLRFVFDSDRSGQLLGRRGDPEPDGPPLSDLILSWEAWRSPGVDFSVVQGLQAGRFELSLRAYSGPQRLLEDILQGHDWYASTLALPGGREGTRELLKVALTLGDGYARKRIDRLLDLHASASEYGGPGGSAEAWAAVRAKLDASHATSDLPAALAQGPVGYQTLLRSCGTLALYTIDLSVRRLYERGERRQAPPAWTGPALEPAPQWMDNMARADLVGMFLRAPHALAFVLRHPTVIPSRIPDALDAKGLLLRQDGRARERHFSARGVTPYGRLRDSLIR